MTEKLTLYTHPMSRGRTARWMLEEIGQPYDCVILEFGTTMKAPEYRAINPMGKVPTVTHGAHVVTECAAICAYLADAFPEAGLLPDDRAAYFRWMFFGAGPLEAAVTNNALGMAPATDRSTMLGYGSLADALDTLEHALSANPYLAGPAFSAVDVATGAQVVWGLAFGTIQPRPAFLAYRDRIAARPAAVRANALDDALMPAKP